MYLNKAKKIEIYHANENSEIYKIGGNYQRLRNSQIINVEFQQEDNTYTAKFIDIYIEYVIETKQNHVGDLQKIYKVFLKYAGNDMMAELKTEK